MKKRTETVKYTKIAFFSIVSIVTICVVLTVCFCFYMSNNDNIVFLGEKYTNIDDAVGNFIPFGSDHNWYDTDESFKNGFGVAYYGSDKAKNFIYYRDFLETRVFKKNSFRIPDFPETDFTDKLIIVYNDTQSVITLKDDIDVLLNYLSQNDFSGDIEKENQILFLQFQNTTAESFS